MPASTSPGNPGFSGIRVVVVAHGPPMKGGISTVAVDLVEDPELNAEFEMVFQNTAQADDKRGKLSLENIWRSVTHSLGTFRLARPGSVVHTHSVQDGTWVAWRQVPIAVAARLRGAAVLLHNHAYRPYMAAPGGFRVNWLHRLAFRVLDKLADVNILLTPEGLPNLQPLMPHTPMPVVANSVVVDEVVASTVDHDPPVVLFIGELLERKGVLVLLDALDELDRRSLRYELRIVGDNTPGMDPEKDRVVAEVRARGRSDAMTGPVSRAEVYRHLSEADVFVFPTFVEGQPFSVIESLAAGVPVVGSDIPTVAGMITDGVHGLLSAPGDATALAAGLQRVVEDGELRRTMSAACRQRARERYDRSVFRAAVAELYRTYGGRPTRPLSPWRRSP